MVNTIPRKEHWVLESVCDRHRFVQLAREACVVDAMLGAVARCPGSSSGKQVDEATILQNFEGMSKHGTVLVLNFFIMNSGEHTEPDIITSSRSKCYACAHSLTKDDFDRKRAKFAWRMC